MDMYAYAYMYPGAGHSVVNNIGPLDTNITRLIIQLNTSFNPKEAFLGGTDGKESVCNTGNTGSIPGSGRSPGGGNGNPLQYSIPDTSVERGAWWATVHGVTESQTQLGN